MLPHVCGTPNIAAAAPFRPDSMIFLTLVSLSLIAAHSAAFPTLDHLQKLSGPSDAGTLEALNNLQKRSGSLAAEGPIDVSGGHAFVAPDFEAGDVRGPCPGLNMLSNHGYLPRNGVAGPLEYQKAVLEVFNMGVDLGAALGIYGTEVAGNILSLTPGFSMGGSTPHSENLLGNLGGLLGAPGGLTGTHGQYEEDASATRGDLYSDGNNADLEMAYFMELYNLQIDADVPNYTLDIYLEHGKNRYYHSLNTNPYFWYGPIGGTVLRNAAYFFAGRLFANYSAEYPSGILSKDTLKSFHSISGAEGQFVYTRGAERIPENWYRRPTQYGFVQVVEDLVYAASRYPFLLNVGGNTGTVNSFVGIDTDNLTGGVFSAANLLEGNNAVCFGLALLNEFSPSLLRSLYKTTLSPLAALTNALKVPLLSLGCSTISVITDGGTDIIDGWKQMYPGVAKAGWAL